MFFRIIYFKNLILKIKQMFKKFKIYFMNSFYYATSRSKKMFELCVVLIKYTFITRMFVDLA